MLAWKQCGHLYDSRYVLLLMVRCEFFGFRLPCDEGLPTEAEGFASLHIAGNVDACIDAVLRPREKFRDGENMFSVFQPEGISFPCNYIGKIYPHTYIHYYPFVFSLFQPRVFMKDEVSLSFVPIDTIHGVSSRSIK